MKKRINRINRINRIVSVSLAYHGLKSEFLNSFVSLILQRINRIIFRRVSLLIPCLIIKKIIIRRPATLQTLQALRTLQMLQIGILKARKAL